jgi:hypothetical protein
MNSSRQDSNDAQFSSLVHVHEEYQSFAYVDIEPEPHELDDDVWIEVASREWDDEKLLDDARPGRRNGREKAHNFGKSKSTCCGCCEECGWTAKDSSLWKKS